MLTHISVTTGVTTQGAGMLKNLTRFDWPLILRGAAYADGRQQIEGMTRTAVTQVQASGVDPDLLDKLNAAVKSMEDQVGGAIQSMTPTQYVQGTRYLRQLRDSLQMLQDPNAVNYFNGKYQARGNTVAELVNNMSSERLRFAPGAEPYYSSLHRDMVTYEYRLRDMGAR
jgi:hypothetical protein